MKFTDAVGEAWEQLKDDKSDVTYVLVGYDDKKTIGLKGKGPAAARRAWPSAVATATSSSAASA